MTDAILDISRAIDLILKSQRTSHIDSETTEAGLHFVTASMWQITSWQKLAFE
jgi:hypothetical protein